MVDTYTEVKAACKSVAEQWTHGCMHWMPPLCLHGCFDVSVRFSWFIPFSLQFQQSADGWSGAHARRISSRVSISPSENITIQPCAGQHYTIIYNIYIYIYMYTQSYNHICKCIYSTIVHSCDDWELKYKRLHIHIIWRLLCYLYALTQ